MSILFIVLARGWLAPVVGLRRERELHVHL